MQCDKIIPMVPLCYFAATYTRSSQCYMSRTSLRTPSSIVLKADIDSSNSLLHLLLFMTLTLATIRFKSALLLCYMNAIDVHPIRIQFNLLRMRIKTRLQ